MEPRRVLYSYYTAGSGGVGPTILETSLLLAGSPVVVFANGEKVPASTLKLLLVCTHKFCGWQLCQFCKCPDVKAHPSPIWIMDL